MSAFVQVGMCELSRSLEKAAARGAKLSDSESEAAETQAWLQFCVECEYAPADEVRELYIEYDNIIGMLVNMIKSPEKWTL